MGFVRSDLEYILGAVKAAEERARAQPPALTGGFFQSESPDAATEESADQISPSAAWMSLFSRFFDYRFEAAETAGPGARFIPLSPGDPHFDPASERNYLILETARPAGQYEEASPPPSPYARHPAHLALLRAYDLRGGALAATGAFLTGPDGGAPSWEDVKKQALELLGLDLDDADMLDPPLLATDPFGALALGPNGRAQLVGAASLVEIDPAAPSSAAFALRTGQPLFDKNGALSLPVEQHNRAVQDVMAELLQIGEAELLSEWLDQPVDASPAGGDGNDLAWNGDLLFQTARFGAETSLLSENYEESDEADESSPLADALPVEATADDDAFDLAFLATLARQAAASPEEADPLGAALASGDGQIGEEDLAASEEVVIVQLLSPEEAAGLLGAGEIAEDWRADAARDEPQDGDTDDGPTTPDPSTDFDL